MINVYLDDLRPEPDGFTLARNVSECIELFMKHQINIVSLDHDLGEKKTGYDFVKWLFKNYFDGKVEFPKVIILHTANPVGRQNMAWMINKYMPAGTKFHQFPLYFGNCYTNYSD